MPPIPWLRQKGESVPISRVSDNVPEASEGMYKGILMTTPPTLLALSAFTVGSVTTLAATATYLRFGRRIQNGGWITPRIFKQKRWIKGIVTTVGDGDNFRLYHVPTLGGHIPFRWLRRIPSTPRELRHKTIHIRIAGVDAPEASHFGRPAQPYAVESIEWLRGMILGKTVYCQLLQRDQYSRVVANVFLAPRLFPGFLVTGKNIALEMLRAGWATTYEQAGAEYGESGKEEFLRIEAEAKAARRGMWKNGTKIETPSEYKRRHAAKKDARDQEEVMEEDAPRRSWMRRLLRR